MFREYTFSRIEGENQIHSTRIRCSIFLLQSLQARNVIEGRGENMGLDAPNYHASFIYVELNSSAKFFET